MSDDLTARCAEPPKVWPRDQGATCHAIQIDRAWLAIRVAAGLVPHARAHQGCSGSWYFSRIWRRVRGATQQQMK